MVGELSIGSALRRFRRLHGIKQGHAAEMLGVSQGSVSRWESGTHQPDTASRAGIIAMISARADGAGDATLKMLVSTSSLSVHLVCDATHQLLAASPARAAAWRVNIEAWIGCSLWHFASPEIVAAEAGLLGMGWYDRPFQQLQIRTGSNGSNTVIIRPGLMQWETIALADGRVGRLTTAIS
jgi:transcriptional regulator with XRE-family HTH domain